MKTMRWKAAWLFLALGLAFGVGLCFGINGRIGAVADAAATTSAPGFTVTIGSPNAQPSNVDMSQFWNAWNLLQQNFVETHASGTIPTDQQKIYGAITGLTDSYGDPYTTFFPPAQAQIFTSDI